MSALDIYLKNLFYAGEKKPHMLWIEFEPRFNLALQTYVKIEGRVFHSDEMKLHALPEKVKCKWINTYRKRRNSLG